MTDTKITNKKPSRRAGRRSTDAVVTPTVIGLAEIVAAGENGIYTTPAIHQTLIEQGLVEVNPELTNEAGEIATRATPEGIKKMSKNTVEVAGFEIEEGVEMPTRSRAGRKTAYPFDVLNVGQSFFVANTEDKPDAVKSMASTVSSANNRYSVPSEDGATRINRKGEEVPVMVQTRRFECRPADKDGEQGARVWRVM